MRSDRTAALTLLDFGCVQPVDRALKLDMRLLLQAEIRQEDLREPLRVALGFRDIEEGTLDLVAELGRGVLAPIHASQPFQFTKDFALGISKAMLDAKFSLAGGFLSTKNHFVLDRDGIIFAV